MVQRKDKGTGVKVRIKTPEKHHLVTAEQYANAAITAFGQLMELTRDWEVALAEYQGNRRVCLSSLQPQTFEAKWVQLEAKRTEVAQQELEVTNKIGAENANQKDSDSSKLDKALIKIKKNLRNSNKSKDN